MRLSKSLKAQEKAQYIRICRSIWGCVPVDYNWAINTNIYKQKKIYERT